MAKRGAKGRDISGILLLDKPQGLTSNQALQRAKRLFNAKKAGHTGSLDPLATGMLPVCFGEATKISNYLLNADKRYHAVCKLGQRTDSADADGKVISTRPTAGVSEQQIRQVLQQFEGEIQQVPPMHSAIKQDGVPLYKLAHQGIEVAREARIISIYEISLINWQKDTLELDIRCSKGTYVRSLGVDLARHLNCNGHVSQLRRLASGEFTLRQAVFVPKLKSRGYVRLYNPSLQFLGIGEVLEDGRVAPKRLMNLAKIG